jgi:uncharacterized protein DUF1573
MKKVIIALLCLSISGLAAKGQDVKTISSPGVLPAAQGPAQDPDGGKFKFKEETHDYGEVPEGPLAEYDFEFVNTGKKPIMITEAHGSCGCTVPKWPTEPILPGKEGKIHVSYNTNGRQGAIQKDVTITSNAQQQPMVLHIKGFVKPKPIDQVSTVKPGK